MGDREKVYVDVYARFQKDGTIMPVKIIWKDGRQYEIDKVLDAQRAASLKAGGVGIRYRCRINRKETFIWYDDHTDQWFVEGKKLNHQPNDKRHVCADLRDLDVLS